MPEFYHSVTLSEDKCKGCTNCIKRCPNEAIRVRNGKARIIATRCIDCGECIRVCPHHAKRAVTDSLELMKRFKHTIALPAPTLYGQFNNLSDVDYVLNGLLEMGFDSVFEVSKAAEIVSDATRRMLREGIVKKPVISSACPAAVRLIRVKYPNLCGNVLPVIAPMQLAGKLAKEEVMAKTGLDQSEIGVFFITPCPAKMTDIVLPLGMPKSWVDGAFSIADVYPRLLDTMKKVATPKPLSCSGIIGVSWATSGGECAALIRDKYLAADGIENVISVLEEMEGERLREIEFIELNACRGGCVGGVLTVENPYVAKARIQRLRKYMPVSLNHAEDAALPGMRWDRQLEFAGVLGLSDDMSEAITMMGEIDELEQILPSLDCGSCGAPSCRALAEDIVRGKAQRNDCVFILREEASSAGIDVSKDVMHLKETDAEKTTTAESPEEEQPQDPNAVRATIAELAHKEMEMEGENRT